MRDEILLRRRKAIFVDVPSVEINEDEKEKRDIALASICKNIESYGYLLSNEMISLLQETDYTSLVNWYLNLKTSLLDEIGLRKHMEPVFKNFPKDVMSADESTIYMASLTYYLSNNTISPSEYEERPELKEFHELIPLTLAYDELYSEIFTNLLSSKISFGINEKRDIESFISENENFENYIPDMPNKDNLVYMTNLLITKFGYEDERTLSLVSKYKNAKDVLRLAISLSNGNISKLNKKTNFKKFSKKERRFLLSLLDNCKNPLVDMQSNKTNWIILGETLHPGDYATRYPNAYKNFYALRNNEKVTSFQGKINQFMKENNLKEILKLYSKKPGEFCRNIDNLFIHFENEQMDILNEFEKVANKVSTKVLVDLYQHVQNRKNPLDTRVFFPKGNISNAYFMENNAKPINEDILNQLNTIIIHALLDNYKQKEPMGNVYLDEALKDYKFPLTIRNTSRSIKSLARGTKMPLPENCNVLRAFLYWKQPNPKEDIDLDLSIILLDKDFKIKGTCYYGNYDRNDVRNLGSYHSGDIRKAPNGDAEYIDMDLKKYQQNGIEHVLVCAHSFTTQYFYQLEEGFIGLMARENPLDGEIFEPKTVLNRYDLISEQTTSLSMMINVSDRNFTWLDIGVDSSNANDVANNIKRTNGNMIPIAKNFDEKYLVSIYDIISLNIQARGTLVNDKKDADFIFSLTGYEPTNEQDTQEEMEKVEEESQEEIQEPSRILITPFETDVLLNYL